MKKFIKNNTLIFWLGVASALFSVSYAATYNMPDYFGLEGWYSLLNNLSISYLAALIFYVTQVYIPQYKQNQQAHECIRLRIENVVCYMGEIFDKLGDKYIENYSRGVITEKMLLDMLQRINVDDQVAVLDPRKSVFDEGGYFTVREWIISRVEFVEHEIDSIFKYYPIYITPELMKTMEKILRSTMHCNLARIYLKKPNGTSFSGCNQDIFLKPYYNLMNELENVKKMYDIL